MAIKTISCEYEVTSVLIRGYVMDILVDDFGDINMYRYVNDGDVAGWAIVAEIPSDLNAPVSPFSVALARGERIADGLEPCPPVIVF
jgi:hypothetical protein